MPSTRTLRYRRPIAKGPDTSDTPSTKPEFEPGNAAASGSLVEATADTRLPAASSTSPMDASRVHGEQNRQGTYTGREPEHLCQDEYILDATGKSWKIHPLARLMPAMSTEAYELLKQSIQAAGGNRNAIVVTSDDQVLDGVHRLRACTGLGLEPKIEAWDGRGTELDVVLDLNDRRRHLNLGQRALMAARMATMSRGRPKKNNCQKRG